jgi:hypothetical protein
VKLIETKTLAVAAASIEFTSIPQTFTDLVLLYNFRDTRTNSTFRVQSTFLSFNTLTTNFSARTLLGTGSGAGSSNTTARFAGWHPDAASTSNTFGNGILYIPNYSGSTNKSYSADAVTENNETTAYLAIIAGLWSNTAAITGITMTTDGTTYAIGSTVSLYGITSGSDGIVTVS